MQAWHFLRHLSLPTALTIFFLADALCDCLFFSGAIGRHESFLSGKFDCNVRWGIRSNSAYRPLGYWDLFCFGDSLIFNSWPIPRKELPLGDSIPPSFFYRR